jgi:competence protein ComEA
MRILTSLFALTCALPILCWADSVNINTADARTLAKELKGIGVARAQAIVAYRNEHGPFKTPDDLGLVKGIAQKVIDQNRASIKLDGSGGGVAKSPASASKPDTSKGGQKSNLSAETRP